MRLFLLTLIILSANLFFATAQDNGSDEKIAKEKIKELLPTDGTPLKKNASKIMKSLENLFHSEESDIILKRHIIDFALDSLYPEVKEQMPALLYETCKQMPKYQEEKIWSIVESEFEQNIPIKEPFVHVLLLSKNDDYLDRVIKLRKADNPDNNDIRKDNIIMIRARLYATGRDEELEEEALYSIKELYRNSGDTISTRASSITRSLILDGNTRFYSFIVPYILNNPNKIIKSYIGGDGYIYSSIPEFFSYLFELDLEKKICPNRKSISKEVKDGCYTDIDSKSKEDFWNWCRKYNKTLNMK